MIAPDSAERTEEASFLGFRAEAQELPDLTPTVTGLWHRSLTFYALRSPSSLPGS